jgi:hypothetical protein
MRGLLATAFPKDIRIDRDAAVVSAPNLRAVADVQNFDDFFGVTVNDDVGRADQFASLPDLSGPADAGKVASRSMRSITV